MKTLATTYPALFHVLGGSLCYPAVCISEPPVPIKEDIVQHCKRISSCYVSRVQLCQMTCQLLQRKGPAHSSLHRLTDIDFF